ncbi:MAG TPA: ribosome silencing factor [Tepidisphaeraceae bacterium]
MSAWRCSIATEKTTKATVTSESKERLAAARAFAVEAARLAANTRCHNVVVLDVGGLSPVCDFFVIATGTSPRQMRSVADDVVELAEAQNFRPLHESGLDGATWILVDCVDVIVHFFNEDARHYYDLENLWGDAKHVDWHQQHEQPEGPNKP